MRNITASVGPLAAASANNIATSQTPGGAGALTLNGSTVTAGVATLDVARRVLVTTVSNESAKTLTISGTDRAGNLITETMTGPNAGTGYTIQDFKTVTSVTVSAAFTGAVTVGTNGVASSRWVFLDPYAMAPVAIGVDATGTVNWTVEQCNDDVVGGTTAPGSTVWLATADTNLATQTASKQGAITAAPAIVRLTVNSGATSVGISMNVIQPSAVPG